MDIQSIIDFGLGLLFVGVFGGLPVGALVHALRKERTMLASVRDRGEEHEATVKQLLGKSGSQALLVIHTPHGALVRKLVLFRLTDALPLIQEACALGHRIRIRHAPDSEYFAVFDSRTNSWVGL